MKIITVVGIRKSGKTGTVEALLRELKARGLKAGSCKTVFCPTFSMDKAGSNTARHRAAGAALVTARARNETALIWPKALPLSKLLEAYRGMDWVLLEGDYEAPVPRLVAAHHRADAVQRMNDRTLAFTGRVSCTDEELPLPRFNALTDAAALIDFLDARVPDIEPDAALDEKLPPVAGVSDDGFCQCGCHHSEHRMAAEAADGGRVAVIVDGRPVSLTEEMRKTVLSWTEKR